MTHDAARAALQAFLGSLDVPCVVVVTPLAPGADPQVFKLPAPQASHASDLTPCADDVLYVVGEAAPLTTTQLLTELANRGLIHGDSTVKLALSQLVKQGKLANPQDAKPRGYRLP